MNEFILTTCNFTKNHFKMINFPTKITLRYFQGFCLKVSDDLFYRTTPCMFVVNRLCTVFLRESRFMLTIRGIPENRDPGHQWDPKKTPENRDSEPYKNRKTGTLKSKTRYRSGAGKDVPNVTLENLYKSKSTFIYVLVQKATKLQTLQFHFI